MLIFLKVVIPSNRSLGITCDVVKMRGSHLTCKVASKCLIVCERVEVLSGGEKMVPSFPLFSYESAVSVKKTLIEKKKDVKYFHSHGRPFQYRILKIGWNSLRGNFYYET